MKVCFEGDCFDGFEHLFFHRFIYLLMYIHCFYLFGETAVKRYGMERGGIWYGMGQ